MEDTRIFAVDKPQWWNEGLEITLFSSVKDAHGALRSTTLARFYQEHLDRPRPYPRKDLIPGWSQARFKGDQRSKENVLSCSLLVLDLEPPKSLAEEGATIEQIHEVWSPTGYLLHASYSHRLPGPTHLTPRNCYRLLLPLSRSVTGPEYEQLLEWAFWRQEGRLLVDTSTSDSSRFWFLPALRAGVEQLEKATHWIEGALDVDTILAFEAERIPPPLPYQPVSVAPNGKNPAYVQAALDRAVQAIFNAPHGTRNDLLNREGFSLGGLVGAGALDEALAFQALFGATRSAGWKMPIKNEATLRRALRDGAAQPRVIPGPKTSYPAREARVGYLDNLASEPAAPLPAPEVAPPAAAPPAAPSEAADPPAVTPSYQEIRQAILNALQGTEAVEQGLLLARVRTTFPSLVRPSDEAILALVDTLIEEEIVDLSPEGDYWLIDGDEGEPAQAYSIPFDPEFDPELPEDSLDPNAVADHPRTPGGAEPPAPPPPAPPSGGDGGGGLFRRPLITLVRDRTEVIDATLDAMGQTRAFFQKGGELVEPVREWLATSDGKRTYARMVVKKIHHARFEELLCRHMDFEKLDNVAREMKPANPPVWLMQQLYNRGTWDTALPLRGATEAPVLRPDGTLLCEEGYDEATGLIYRPNAAYLPVDLYPTLEAVQQAKQKLLSLVKDFPFESAAHRSVWLAALLTPICRPAFDGPAPLFLFDANVRAAGKTKLVHLIGRILQGENVDAMAYTSDDIEMEKKIFSIAKNGQTMTFFDDIGGQFGTPSLNNALTSTRFQGRTLGFSDMASYDLKTVWYASGNNVQVFRDMARRIAHIRLRSSDQNPEHRELPDVLREAKENRTTYLHAAHTLILGWVAAGRPRQKIKGWGSFEGWSDMLRQIVLWVGEPDPGETRDEMAQNSDTEGNALASLIEGWARLQDKKMRPEGLTAKMVFEHLDNNRSDEDLDGLREAIDVLCPGSKDRSRQLGNRLSHLRDRVVEGRCLSHGDDKRSKAGVLWTVRKVEAPPPPPETAAPPATPA